MSTFTDPWHFARPDLAQAYLQGFDIGLTSARGLFARRRMGKTEFLKHDLLPAALLDGYLAAYTVPRGALRRLTSPRLQLLARVDHGTYRFEDTEFQAWVAARRTID
ncbi:MAG: hypothetical protein ABIR56_05940 [Polaromonas sp.]